MAVPPLIFVVCLAVGVYASTRWLPGLAPGPVGGFAFFVVCGLLAAALALVGLDICGTVDTPTSDHFDDLKRTLLANGLASLLWEPGALTALAAADYLLAPPRKTRMAR